MFLACVRPMPEAGRAVNRLDPDQPVDADSCRFEATFTDARDLARFAETSPEFDGSAGCESWHLDRHGRFVCGTNATPSDSLASWAADPERLVHTFLEFRSGGTCTPNWVVVDQRCGSEAQPGEHDAEQFLRLRHQLDVAGVTLMDCVIFADDGRWWSLCELLTGSTAWGSALLPGGTPNRLRPTI